MDDVCAVCRTDLGRLERCSHCGFHFCDEHTDPTVHRCPEYDGDERGAGRGVADAVRSTLAAPAGALDAVRSALSDRRPSLPSVDLSTPSLRVPRPDLGIPRPTVRIPRPDLPVSRSSLRIPRPSLGTLRPDVGVPRPGLRVPRPDLRVPRPSRSLPSLPSVGVSRPNLRIPRPDLRIPRPSLGIPRPSLGIPRPDRRVPRPSLGLSWPSLGMPRPSVDISRPNLGFPQPSLGLSRPSLDISRPSFDLLRPSRSLPSLSSGDATPSVRLPAPHRRLASAARRAGAATRGGVRRLRGATPTPPTVQQHSLRRVGVAAVLLLTLVVGFTAGGSAAQAVATLDIFDQMGQGEPEPVGNATPPDTAELERAIVAEIVDLRIDADRRPYTRDPGLTELADYHGADMAERGYASVVSPSGENVTDRFERFDYDCSRAAQMVLWVEGANATTHDELAASVVDQWLASGEHASVLESEDYSRVGVSVARAETDRLYVSLAAC